MKARAKKPKPDPKPRGRFLHLGHHLVIAGFVLTLLILNALPPRFHPGVPGSLALALAFAAFYFLLRRLLAPRPEAVPSPRKKRKR